MIVNYKIVGAGGWSLLFDESAGAQLLEEFAPKFFAKVQEDPLAGGSASFRTPQGNVSTKHNLKFMQSYASLALSVASIRTFASAFLNTKFHLQVIQDSEVQYYPNAVASGYDPKLEGVSVTHTLQCTSDNVTNNAPST